MEAAKARVVVADDDDDIRQLMKLSLGYSGFEVIDAHDGIRALRAVEEGRIDAPIDLVILDGAMPVLTGVGCAKVIRLLEELHRQPPVKIAFLTGHDEIVADEDLLNRMNISAVWKKPDDVTRLPELVEALLKSE